jgi:hypothetical protein
MRKRRDTIPEHFNSAEEAGECWDTRSAGDYGKEVEEVEMAFDIQKRAFLVPVDAWIYLLAKEKAEAEHTIAEQIINTLLNRELAKT